MAHAIEQALLLGRVLNRIDLPGIGREVVGKHKDGATFPLELSVAELQLTHERLFTGILRDISDRKQAEAEWHRINEHLEELVMERTQALADAQEALVRKERLATLGQLAGSVAHEIRNPLGIVQNAAFYLEQVSQDKDTDTVESFAEIRRGLSRANHIITELLEYARDPQTHHRVFDLKDAVDEAFEGVAIIPDVSVMREVEAVQCEGDPGQVSQILRNLIINASQSMPHGGNLTVSGRRDGEKVVVEVRDSGSGISEEQLGKIFEPLFTTKTRGIGLGLALSLRYAELNHATLEVESRLGEGAIFRLILREHPKACA